MLRFGLTRASGAREAFFLRGIAKPIVQAGFSGLEKNSPRKAAFRRPTEAKS